jgi:hypothetical protein
VGEPTVINDANLDHEVLADLIDFSASNGDPQPAELLDAEDPSARFRGDLLPGEAALDRECISVGVDSVLQQSEVVVCPADLASRPTVLPYLDGSSIDSCGNQTSAPRRVGAAPEIFTPAPSKPQDSL